MSHTTALTTENDAEWMAVAHVRGYPHLPTACPVCRAGWEGVAKGKAMAAHPSSHGVTQ